MSPTHYRRSPGLDGLRGLFMGGFMAFHFGATFLAGGWIAINHFFVLSGFLITRLLVEEHERHGAISFRGFYLRRARRILPALFALLSVILLWAIFFAEGTDKRRFGGDILATLGFVMNWRLISQSDDYFGDQLNASPLRHAWTLSIEEQFYALAPLVVLLLMRYVRTRRSRALVLLLAGVVATVWTAKVTLDNPTSFARLYYGTDTRVTSLLIGAALGCLLGWSRRHGLPRRNYALYNRLSWLGLIGTVGFMWGISPQTDWMYTKGGMLLGALSAAAVIGGIAHEPRTLLARALSWKPLRRFGQISYSMYLWHWPVRVLLGEDSIARNTVVTGFCGFWLSVALAWVSTKYLEEPVMRHGVRGILPRLRRRWVGLVAPLTAIVVGTAAFLLPQATANELGASGARAMAIAPGQPAYTPGEPAAIGVFGDSVPWYLVKRYQPKTFPGVTPVNLAHEGCNLLELRMKTVFGPQDQAQFCGSQRADWPQWLADSHAKVFLVFGDSRLGVPHYLPDGTLIQLGEPRFEQAVMAKLDDNWRRAKQAGAEQVQVVTVPCRKFGYAADDNARATNQRIARDMPNMVKAFEDPSQINAIFRRWVERTPGAKLVDLHGALCGRGFQPTINGVTLYNDGLHFSPEVTPSIWAWLLGQVSQRWAERS